MADTDDGARVVAERAASPAVGADILELITSGMYTDPMAVYREYIQNAADAVEGAGTRRSGRVDIALDVDARRLRIKDNGPGLNLWDAERALVPIAQSGKRGQRCRGFRGIGRLVGLAFGESVTFLTRAGRHSPLVRVVWDGHRLRSGLTAGRSFDAVLTDCVSVEAVEAEGVPDCFFEVIIDGISRSAAASLMNKAAVRAYIGEVCPVPFRAEFPYASEILALFTEEERPLTLDVRLDGDTHPIERPHSRRVVAAEAEDVIDLEGIQIPGLRGGDVAAVGWIAHSEYRGAIPRNRGVRCLRARMGNIQVGGERTFDHLFVEDRFNRWCVAEIHVLEPAIVPNARRDYFEPSPHLRNLENHLGAVCRRLEARCRTASRERNQQRRYRRFVDSVAASLELAMNGYLPADVVDRMVARQLVDIAAWRQRLATIEETRAAADELAQLETRLRGPLRHAKSVLGVNDMEVQVYRKVFGLVAEHAENFVEAKRTIELILAAGSGQREKRNEGNR